MTTPARAGDPDRAAHDTDPAGPAGVRPDHPASYDDFVPPKRNPWYFLLLVPAILPLLTPIWNRQSPELFGIPFFYWSQLALVIFCSIVVGTVYLMTKRK